MEQDLGWIKLHRVLTKKAIWKCSTPQQKVILVTLLMMANHEENEWLWQGREFKAKPGQFVTSLDSIKAQCGKGVSIKNIRTALVSFEKSGFLANKSAKTGRLITIVKWADYQGSKQATGKAAGKQPANNRQTGGKQLASNNNDNNDNNVNNVNTGEAAGNLLKIKKDTGNGRATSDPVYLAFSNNIHPITPMEFETLNEYRDAGMDAAVIVWAIKQAVVMGKRNVKYIAAILKNLQKEGIVDIAGAEARERERAEQLMAGPGATGQKREPTCPRCKSKINEADLHADAQNNIYCSKCPDKEAVK